MPAEHYNTINVHPKAPQEVINAAYRALSKIHVGDKKRLQALNEAKEVLLDTAKRAAYDAAHAKPPGKVVGPYRIVSKLAEGGFGVTYKAEHVTLGTPVCIKHSLNVSPSDEKILLDEAKIIWDLRHWGIPAMRDLLRMPDDSIALVMSYVPGLTLAQIKEKNYPTGIEAEHVAWIAERCLNTLKYLHMHGVMHGDMKPQNIIVQPESHTVTLVDYGLAIVRPAADSTTKGYTPYFAAPEQLADKALLPETDLYGLGMTMVYALGGDVEHVRVPDSTPAPLCEFIKRLIRRDPLRRPKVWQSEDLCDTIKSVRKESFGRDASGMKPLKI